MDQHGYQLKSKTLEAQCCILLLNDGHLFKRHVDHIRVRTMTVPDPAVNPPDSILDDCLPPPTVSDNVLPNADPPPQRSSRIRHSPDRYTPDNIHH